MSETLAERDRRLGREQAEMIGRIAAYAQPDGVCAEHLIHEERLRRIHDEITRWRRSRDSADSGSPVVVPKSGNAHIGEEAS